MAKYRKRPVVIEAIQYTGKNMTDVLAWSGLPEITEHFGGGLDIVTLEGTMRADKGDWIIRGVKGELYPCKPDIFEATHEAV